MENQLFYKVDDEPLLNEIKNLDKVNHQLLLLTSINSVVHSDQPFYFVLTLLKLKYHLILPVFVVIGFKDYDFMYT